MNIVLEYKRSIAAEIYKFRRTFTLWLLILAPAFIPTIMFFVFWSKGHEIVGEGQNPWQLMLGYSLNPASFLFPFFVMIVALFVNNIEHNANTWKLIYTQPLKRSTVFFSKMKVYIVMVFSSLMLFGLFTILVGYLLSVIRPELGFDQEFDKTLMYGLCFKLFLTSLAYASIQFAVSQKWKNLMLPLGIGLAGIISFMIVVQGWEYAEYHPYGYHILALRVPDGEEFQLWENMKFIYRSVGVAAVVFALSAWDMLRKRII